MGGHFEHIWLYGDVSPSIYILFWQPCLNRKTFWRSWSKRVFDIFCLVNDSDFACCSKISSVIIFLLWLKKHYTEVGKIISLNTHNISSLLSCDTFLSPSLRSHRYFPAGYVLGGGGANKTVPSLPPTPSLVCTVLCVTRGWPGRVFYKAPPWGLHPPLHTLPRLCPIHRCERSSHLYVFCHTSEEFSICPMCDFGVVSSVGGTDGAALFHTNSSL